MLDNPVAFFIAVYITGLVMGLLIGRKMKEK